MSRSGERATPSWSPDTAFYRYAYYHTTAWDTPEKLNYAAIGRVVDGLEQALAALAGRPEKAWRGSQTHGMRHRPRANPIDVE